MIKTLVTTLIAVAILFTAGAIENNCVTKSFDKFYLILEQAEKKLTENTATVQGDFCVLVTIMLAVLISVPCTKLQPMPL